MDWSCRSNGIFLIWCEPAALVSGGGVAFSGSGGIAKELKKEVLRPRAASSANLASMDEAPGLGRKSQGAAMPHVSRSLVKAMASSMVT
jgi:hypothetical protein